MITRQKIYFAVLMFFLAYSDVTAAGTVSISILPFGSRSGENDQWLGTAIADMLALNLAESKNISVLDRGHLQVYLRELDFQQSGFVETETAHRISRIASVDQVLLGHFSLTSDRQLSITLLSTNTDSQAVTELTTISSSLDQLAELVEMLAITYLKNSQRKVDDDELSRIRQLAYVSLPAMEHFYRGLTKYDKGLPAQAFSEFYLATKVDKNLLRARLWMAQALLDMDRQEMAISIYRQLYQKFPDRVEALDAQLKAAELLLDDDPAAAFPLLQELFTRQTGTPHYLYAAMQLGRIYTERNELRKAYTSYAVVDNARANVEKSLPEVAQGQKNNRLKPGREIKSVFKSSSFVRWEDALDLYKPALQKMVDLYARMYRSGNPEELPQPPRGVILVKPGTTEIKVDHTRRPASLFHERVRGDNWREDFYVLIMPRGYLADSARVAIRGKLTDINTTYDYTIKLHQFPLNTSSGNNWLGVLYGQTANISRLQKTIPFYGMQQDVFIVQIVENHGRVFDWSVTPSLRKNTKISTTVTELRPGIADDTEAVLQAVIPVRQTDAGQPQLIPKEDSRSLAISSMPGLRILIASLQDADNRQRNLYVSESVNTGSWSDFSMLPVNSLSDDISPSLVKSEDGNLHLFWLSNRLGQGWTLWHSYRARKTGLWSLAERVHYRSNESDSIGNTPAKRPFQYTVLQNRTGEWILALNDFAASAIQVLTSADTQKWETVSTLPYQSVVHNLALGVDNTSRYHLALFTGRNSLVMLQSDDIRNWKVGVPGSYQGFGDNTTSLYPASLTAETDGNMVLLFADTRTGVQYSRFLPGQPLPESDLVKDANLYPYTAARDTENNWLLAMATGEGVEIRQYRKFHAAGNPRNSQQSMIYREIEKDPEGNEWQRIFARPRMILPDVSAVAVARNGRIWWGIETGIMSLYHQQFTMRDVAQGFFNNNVTDIVACGDRAVFAAGDYAGLTLGTARAAGERQPAFRTVNLGGRKQSVTAMICLQDRVLMATSGGSLRLLNDSAWELLLDGSPDAVPLTTLAADKGGQTVWAGSSTGDIYRIRNLHDVKKLPAISGNAVSSMTVSSNGQLWVAIENEGIYIWQPASHHWAPLESQPYKFVGDMLADDRNGVWISAGDNTRSKGLVYHNGTSMQWFNPPSRTLTAPTGMARDRDGNIWVGTSFHGLYRLKVAKK